MSDDIDSTKNDLEVGDTNLENIIQTTETELLPPDDNDSEEDQEESAKELNFGNIFLIVILFLAVFFLIILFGGKEKKQDKSKTLDKAGSKYEYDFPDTSVKEDIPEEVTEPFNKPEDEDKPEEEPVDLPPEYQIPPAPVAPIGTTSHKSDRPDTRNSNSIRRVEGLVGRSNNTYDSNTQKISNVLSGRNEYSRSPSVPFVESKEEKMKSQLEMIKNLQSGYQPVNQQQYYQSNKEEFFNQRNTAGSGYYMSDSSIWDGTIISGALITAINTDNPGIVIARVTENVYSSYDHSYLLIPEGSMLYATYNSSVSYGQNRVQVIWNLLIRPDGFRISLGNMNGVDSQGASGYEGHVSNHPFETLKALGLVAVFSIIQTEITGQINTANNQYAQNAMNDVYSEASKLGNRILDKALDIKPTIKLPVGKEIKIITNAPLELPPVQVSKPTNKYVRTR